MTKPRIVVVTGNQPHMNYFVKRLYEEHHLVGVLYFDDYKYEQTCKQCSVVSRIIQVVKARKWNRIFNEKWYGYGYANMHFHEKSTLPSHIPTEKYNSTDKDKNTKFIVERRADIVLCHGGPIYGGDIINSASCVVNFHSGISPIYNGAHSHFYAFCNGDVRWVGGTLMELNRWVDGGDLIGYAFPKVERNDVPRTLFKSIIEAGYSLIDLYVREFAKGKRIPSVKQGPTINYFKTTDMNLKYILKFIYNLLKRRLICFERKKQIITFNVKKTQRRYI